MQDTVILCIDIWNYHHCISQIHKSNYQINKTFTKMSIEKYSSDSYA